MYFGIYHPVLLAVAIVILVLGFIISHQSKMLSKISTPRPDDVEFSYFGRHMRGSKKLVALDLLGDIVGFLLKALAVILLFTALVQLPAGKSAVSSLKDTEVSKTDICTVLNKGYRTFYADTTCGRLLTSNPFLTYTRIGYTYKITYVVRAGDMVPSAIEQVAGLQTPSITPSER